MQNKLNYKDRMIIIFSLFISTILHMVIIYTPLNVTKIKKSILPKENKILISIIIEKNIVLKKANKENVHNNISLKELGVTKFDHKKIKPVFWNTKIGLNDIKQVSSVHIDIFDRIDEQLNYPRSLINNNLQGIVNVLLRFNSHGIFLERESKYHSNIKHLKVHIVRILRSVFKRPIIMPKNALSFYVKITFSFHLSTGDSKKRENTISGRWLRFYRHAYGGDTIYDNIHKSTPKLSNVLNILWSNRPNFLKSQKTLVSNLLKSNRLESYKDDPAWNY